MNHDKKKIGADGEKLAENYLVSQGYKILARNMSCRYGEIDIIAGQERRIYFVEIRRRRSGDYGSALESISEEKMRHIRRTAESLLMKHQEWAGMIPFLSVIAIDEDCDGNKKIEFLPDAFE